MAKKVSKFREKAKNADEQLEQRSKEAYNKRGDSGKFRSFLSDDMPLTKWSPESGDHVIDVIPYLAGDKHPDQKSDTVCDRLDVYAHRGVGPTEDWVLCPARNYGKPCPICEHQDVMRKNGEDEDDIREIGPKRRVLYQIICLNTRKDEDAGVQLWEVSHWLFDKQLSALSRKKNILFASIDHGHTIEFTKDGKGKGTEYSALYFDQEEREPLDDEILDQTVSIDDYLELKTYEEIEDLFFGETDTKDVDDSDEFKPDSKEEPEKKSRTRSRRASKEEEKEPKKKSRTRSRRDPEDDNGKEEPEKKSRTRSRRASKEEEKEPKKKSRTRSRRDPKDDNGEEEPEKKSRTRRSRRRKTEDEE